jgi:uncharacterized protein with HEPN domain
VTGGDEQRLQDILDSISAIRRHTERGGREELVRDAVLYRIVVIGEAVRALTHDVTEKAPEVPWRQIVRLRDMVTHQYFRVDNAIISQVVMQDLAPLEAAVADVLRR